jgi:aryl-alcohol dehydrogenase-like predicted oxidoreductase
MKQRRLGRTGLYVSELCLGTMHFGRTTPERTAFAILDAFFNAEGNFLQSRGISPGWGFSGPSKSLSETITGDWWRSRGIRRDSIVLATGISLCRPASGGTNAFHRTVRESVGDSLWRLQTDHIDLLVCDWHEGLLPIEDTLDAFDALIRAGMVNHIAAENFPIWRTVDAIGRSRLGYQHRLEGLQADYSLITRSGFETETRELCREYRLGFIASSPLARGFLIKRDASELLLHAQRRRVLNHRYGNPYCLGVFEVVNDLAAARDATPAQLGLAWVLDSPDVTSALIGVGSPQQLSELLGATDIELTFHERKRMDDVTSLEGMRV